MLHALGFKSWMLVHFIGAVVGGKEFHFVENAAHHSTPNKNDNNELMYLYFISLCRQKYELDIWSVGKSSMGQYRDNYFYRQWYASFCVLAVTYSRTNVRVQ